MATTTILLVGLWQVLALIDGRSVSGRFFPSLAALANFHL